MDAVTLCANCGDPTGATAPLKMLYKAAKAAPGNPGSVAFSGRDNEDRPLVRDPRGARCQACAPALVGARVELVDTGDPYTTLTPGDRGTVETVDDTGTVHVAWDSGPRLGLVPERDAWRILNRPDREVR